MASRISSDELLLEVGERELPRTGIGQKMVVDMTTGMVYSLERMDVTVWEMLGWQAGAQHLRLEKLPTRICELRVEDEPHCSAESLGGGWVATANGESG